MLTKGKAIVLSSFKYNEDDLIITCYTSHRGIVSYLQRGILKSKKGKLKAIHFQPLTLLEIDEFYKPSRSLQSLREAKPYWIYRTLHTNLLKASIAMFLSELLSTCLKEEEANTDLYQFLETAFQYLDGEDAFANFHLLFMLRLTRYLGFYPNESALEGAYFDLESGLFETQKSSKYCIEGFNLKVLKTLLIMNFESLDSLKLNAIQRRELLNILLLFFELHLGSFRKPKSLAVFNDIFH